ncbi:MAG: TRAP transporter substrate-binding protein DctP [Dehalococcoidales bacterium]|nr:TRAP transporter substrate-binding protein DctP [Dehalococcoidales bacterium]
MRGKRVLTVLASICLIVILLLPACTQQAAPTTSAPTSAPTTPGATTPAATTAKPTTSVTTTPAPKPAADVIKWKCQSAWTMGTPQLTIPEAYFKRVETATGGRIVITQYPADALIPTAENYTACETGIVQMLNSTSQYWSGKAPEFDIINGYPGNWRTVQDMEELFYQRKPKSLMSVMRPVYEENKTYLIALGGNQPHTFWTKKPITTVAELKGIKMRAPGNTAKVLQTLGVATVNIPHAETYMAFQLGTIDASSTSPTMYETEKYFEFAKYYHVPYIGAPGQWTMLANLAAWKTLPADIKIIIEDESKLAYYDARIANDNMSIKMEAKMGRVWGVTTVQLSQEVLDAVAKASLPMLEKAMAPNARCKEIGEIIKAFMKDVGYLN